MGKYLKKKKDYVEITIILVCKLHDETDNALHESDFGCQPAVLTNVACRTIISIFTSKTFTRFYMTTAVFTCSWTGQVTSLTEIFRIRTSYGINDDVSDILL